MKIKNSENNTNLKIEELTELIISMHKKISDNENFSTDFMLTEKSVDKSFKQIWARLIKEFNLHIYKEEKILFPYLINLPKVERKEIPFEEPYFSNVKKPIEIMKLDHQQLKEYIAQPRDIINKFSFEIQKNEFTQKLQNIFEQIENVIYIEDEVLFPKAMELERKLLKNI